MQRATYSLKIRSSKNPVPGGRHKAGRYGIAPGRTPQACSQGVHFAQEFKLPHDLAVTTLEILARGLCLEGRTRPTLPLEHSQGVHFAEKFKLPHDLAVTPL